MLFKYNMKVITGSSEVPGMNREEVERFLESKLNLQIATIDEKGEPNIQPVSGFIMIKIKENSCSRHPN
jgi:hypothetical protein